ncbi:MAG: ABC transporter permease [Clostridia bacterium]|nr:ABC transporter permease [Clostridia bacterium]
MKFYTFFRRNLKEIVRDPLSLIFCIGFPAILLIVFRIIFSSMGEKVYEATPQFRIDQLVPNMCLFGFTFLSLFVGMLLAKDRTTSFLARLRSTSLRPADFMLGYAVPMLPIALFQEIILLFIGLLFGLNLTANVFFMLLALLPCSVLFIACGVLIGLVLSDKSVGGVASILVNVAVFLSGMFFPVSAMSGGFVTFMKVLPYIHISQIAKTVLTGSGVIEFSVWGSVGILAIYTLALTALSVVVFAKKLRKDNF